MRSSQNENMNKIRMEYALQQEDIIDNNHTYRYEQELLEDLKSGNVDKVRKNIETMYPKYPVVLDYFEKKNEEYMAVISIAIAARGAIEAGVTSVESFQLSDIYLKKLAMAKESEEIKQIRNEALVTYAELVREKRQYRKAGIYVEECKNFIAVNIFKKISSQDVAEAMNLNTIYLERVFKREVGISIGAYIRREKIIRAKNLLIYSDRSIMEISEYLAFPSQSYFGQIFKREVGMTPKQFRIANHMTQF